MNMKMMLPQIFIVDANATQQLFNDNSILFQSKNIFLGGGENALFQMIMHTCVLRHVIGCKELKIDLLFESSFCNACVHEVFPDSLL